MPKTEFQTCDICRTPLSEGSKEITPKMGLTVTIGYSVGGWGHRKNLVDFSGEVCQSCFEGIGPTMAEVFAQVKSHRAGEARRPIPRATVVNVMKTAVRAAKKRWGNR